jgi:hypothetical protein
MYFRTCGWVCLQSLIFPCLVFVLVLGRGGAPERWPSHRTERSKPRGAPSLRFPPGPGDLGYPEYCSCEGTGRPAITYVAETSLLFLILQFMLNLSFIPFVSPKFKTCTSIPWSSRTYLSPTPVLSSVCGFVFFQENLPSKTPWLDTQTKCRRHGRTKSLSSQVAGVKRVLDGAKTFLKALLEIQEFWCILMCYVRTNFLETSLSPFL